MRISRKCIIYGFLTASVLLGHLSAIHAQTGVNYWPIKPFCEYNSANIVPNCGFEKVTDQGAEGWKLLEGKELTVSSIDNPAISKEVLAKVRANRPIYGAFVDLMDYARSGERALKVQSTPGNKGHHEIYIKSDCFPAGSIEDHTFAFRGRQIGYGPETYCSLGVMVFSNECGVDGHVHQSPWDRIHGLNWERPKYNLQSEDAVKGIEIHLVCDSDEPFTILIDDIVLEGYQPPIYEEGATLSREDVLRHTLRQEKEERERLENGEKK